MIRAALALLFLLSAAAAQTTVTNSQTYVLTPQQVPSLTLTFNSGKTQVMIKPDGTIEYGPDYNPDEAARAFWSAIGRNSPCAEKSK